MVQAGAAAADGVERLVLLEAGQPVETAAAPWEIACTPASSDVAMQREANDGHTPPTASTSPTGRTSAPSATRRRSTARETPTARACGRDATPCCSRISSNSAAGPRRGARSAAGA